MEKKYSKSSSFYKSVKNNFFLENRSQLEEALSKNAFYSTQPMRKTCKLCEAKLISAPDFEKHGVKYVFCRACDHLNGLFQDTKSYAEYLYTADGGENYAKFYKDDKYELRLDNIYMPKVEFLSEIIGSKGLSIYDFGCGLGHFVECAVRKGYAAKGGDVSEQLVNSGNELSSVKSAKPPLETIDLNNIAAKLKSLDVDIVSALAVIEHIYDLDEFFEGVRAANFKYFYYSVPTYGFSVIFENLFEEIFPRHLSAGHTHLFTEKSRKLLEKKLGVRAIAEWRFGTDILDLRRSIEITLLGKNVSASYAKRVGDEIEKVQDNLQTVIDQAHVCSQVHVVCEKL